MHRFVENKSIETYKTTLVCDTKCKSFPLGQSNVVDLEIIDTCGEEKFRALTKSYYRQGQGIVLMFDLTEESSFLSLPQWLNDIQSNSDSNVCVVIVGNKIDLLKRKISKKQAQDFAEKDKLEYFEISAQNGINVDLLFEKIAHKVIEIQKLKTEKEEKKIEQDILMKNTAINYEKKNKKREESCC